MEYYLEYIIILVLIVCIVYNLLPRKKEGLNTTTDEESDKKNRFVNYNTSWCYFSKQMEGTWSDLAGDTEIQNLGVDVVDLKCDEKALNLLEIDAASDKPELKLLLDKMSRAKDTGIIIEGKQDLFKKLDIICTAIQAGEDGIKELAYAVAHCGFFRDKNREVFKMSEAVCKDYIKKHNYFPKLSLD